jgi:benzoylformate decarboxylase
MKIADYLLQTLECCGVDTVFGNPGTTEIPLLRSFERRGRGRYVVALSEVAAVPMADGFARARRSLGVVNLHVAPGLGNGMGALYTAGIARTPLLVLIGGQDRRLLHTAPILYGPLERMAAAVCKTVLRLDSEHDAAANVRNAIRSVLTPPFGPVALVCPPDLLENEIDAIATAVEPARLGGLAAAAADDLAQRLCRARSPAFVAAEEVHWHDASAALRALAEQLGAPVYVAPYTGLLPIGAASAAFAGHLSPSFGSIGARLAGHDLLVFAGGRTLRTTLYSPLDLPQEKVWLGDDPTLLAPAGEYEAAHLVDLRAAFTAIGAALAAHLPAQPRSPRRHRPELALPPETPGVFHPTAAVHALAQAFPGAIMFDEAGLSTSDLRQSLTCNAGDYFTNGSGGIGWGLAAAVGGAIGCDQRQVVAIIGDGSALYASEALWSAAHQGTRLLLTVLSNRRYATLNAAATRLTGAAMQAFTLEPPVLDFSGLAGLYGWEFVRARSQAELDATLRRFDGRVRHNTVLELAFDPAIAPVTAARHF